MRSGHAQDTVAHSFPSVNQYFDWKHFDMMERKLGAREQLLSAIGDMRRYLAMMII